MASYFGTSSMIGVDLNNSSTTALFGLNTKAFGSLDSEWQYCIATGTIATGQFVQINTQGTAIAITTAIIANALVPMDIGVCQYTVPQGSYFWVPKRGQQLYVLCSGSLPTTVALGINAGGVLGTGLLGVSTMAGVFLEAAATTVAASVVNATLQWPRIVGVGTSVLG